MVRDAWHRMAVARVGHLATVGPAGAPHLVPCCFALDGTTAVSMVDDKPKTTPLLQRLVDIAARPHAALLVDFYDEDWRRLWWVRAAGPAHVAEHDDRAARLLVNKYSQYVEHRLEGPVVVVALTTWRSWAATG